MSQNVSFNLVDEPWICVRDLGGATREVSLLELFEQASSIKCLANDLPTQDFAILRVLLAVLQRAISPTLDDDDVPAEVWGRLWRAHELPIDQIHEYLDEWHHRFDLFDEEQPFMQVVGLRWKDNEKKENNLYRIIGDSWSREDKRLFLQRAGSGLARLTFAEAARWLVHLQAFALGIPGQPVLGEKAESIKGGKVYPGGPGPDGLLGCMYLEGDSLADTLLLNFLPTASRSDEDCLFLEDDKPCWEVNPLLVSDGHEESFPRGRAELFTWQSRWVRLIPCERNVIDAIVSAGRKMEKSNQRLRQIESMTAWKERVGASRTSGIEFLPRKHERDQAMWRGIISIFGGTAEQESRIVPPEVISWVKRMSGRSSGSLLRWSDYVNVHAVGFEYVDAKCGAVTVVFDDKVELSAYLLSDKGEDLVNLAKELVTSTSKAVFALGCFAANLRIASGGSAEREYQKAKPDEKPKETAKEKASARAFFEIDSPFRQWLAALNETSNAEVERRRWRRTARVIIKAHADVLLREAGPEAIVGAPAQNEKGETADWMTASKAEAKLNAALKKYLPLEEDEPNDKEVQA